MPELRLLRPDLVADDLTRRIAAACDTWRETWATRRSRHSPSRSAPTGSTSSSTWPGHTGQRLLVFARKPAPLQVSWIGYVGTTGLAAMDYLIADRFHVPPGSEHHYRERIIRLPDGYVCFDPPPDAPAVGPLPALQNGHVTFGCFNNTAKISPEVIALWAEIARARPRVAPRAQVSLAERRPHAIAIRRPVQEAGDQRRAARLLGRSAAGGAAGHVQPDRRGTRPVPLLGRPHDLRGALDGRAGRDLPGRDLCQPPLAQPPGERRARGTGGPGTRGLRGPRCASGRRTWIGSRSCARDCGHGSRPRLSAMVPASPRTCSGRCGGSGASGAHDQPESIDHERHHCRQTSRKSCDQMAREPRAVAERRAGHLVAQPRAERGQVRQVAGESDGQLDVFARDPPPRSRSARRSTGG